MVDRELIPRSAAQEIVQQVFKSMKDSIASQVEVSKKRLLEMMLTYFTEACDDYMEALMQQIGKIHQDIK